MNKKLGATLATLCVALAVLSGCSTPADPPQNDKQSSDSKKSNDKKSDAKKDTTKQTDTDKQDTSGSSGGSSGATGNDGATSNAGLNIGDAVPAETIAQWINGDWCYYLEYAQHCVTVSYPIADTHYISWFPGGESNSRDQWHLDNPVLEDTGCYRGEMQSTDPHYPGNARGGWAYCPAGVTSEYEQYSEYDYRELNRLYLPGFNLQAAYRVD
ncbi:hypothetical protein [Leucobacter sp. OH1287]|uniref:hypothetical protein n=1 Tax=Leucobacter sp. OH1287 TaxID=2491049 RepID=UPI000F5DDBC9|nr:hypothetical protein [Leucobacter sp. OH1287]RRD61382.1 hypothetical protein EII30_03000 [Leucobacter sp. OH1287]